MPYWSILAPCLLGLLVLPPRVQSRPVTAAASGDSMSVAATVEQFHAALAAGDSAAALALLSPAVRILEAGGVETLEEYRRGHLPGDIEFARGTDKQPGVRIVTVRGDVAWVSEVTRVHGVFRGRAMDLDSAELMVLVRDGERWRIVAVHWSSRRRSA